MSKSKAVNIFERATRQNLTFSSDKGPLTVQQVWQVTLLSRNNRFDLERMAQDAARDVQESSGQSFVTERAAPVSKAFKEAQLRLDVLKHIIAVKLSEAKEAEAAVANRAQIARINAALSQKDDEALNAATTEELLAKRAELLGGGA